MSKFHFPVDCWFDYTANQVLNGSVFDWMLVCDFVSPGTGGANRKSQFSSFLKQTVTYKM